MIQITVKNDIEQSKLDALLNFLKMWNFEVELKRIPLAKTKKGKDFSLATGLWKDYDINAKTLRKQSWGKS